MSVFDEEYGLIFVPSRHVFKFCLEIEGQRFLFAISQEALTDCFRTEDTKEQAVKNFWEYQDQIIAVAEKFFHVGSADEDGLFVLKSDFCAGLLSPNSR